MKKLPYLIFIFSFFVISAPAFALSSGGVGGYPAHPDPNIKYSESWFIYNLDLGESQDDALTVFNTTDEVQTIKIYAVDSVPSNQGNFALEAEADPKDGIGAWIKLAQTFITLQPGENQEIPFTITIPQNADVGEHSGGIILQKAQGRQDTLESGAAIVTRVGIRVYETVPGEIIKEIEIKDFNVSLKKLASQPAYYEINLIAQNKGNVSLQPKVTLAIGGWGKIKYFTRSSFDYQKGIILDLRDFTDFFTGEDLSRNWQLLRDQKVSTNWTWPKPRFGRFTFQANLTYDTEGGQKTIDSKKITVWVVPWLEVVVLGIIVLLVFCLLVVKKIFFGGRNWQSYIIKTGDNLPQIAYQSKVSLKRLVKVNKIGKPFIIKPGQKISVPPAFNNPKGKSQKAKVQVKS